jgi:transposase
LVFVGIDWAEKHHDFCIIDEHGSILSKGRIIDGIEGIGKLHETMATHVEEPGDAIIGIETDRGLLVGALGAAGYAVFAINPLSVDRYRDRHSTSGAKSDPGDAKILADIVRTDRHNHRQIAGDSDLADAIKLLARTHQSLVWQRQRHVNQLRSALREFYPQALEAFGTELAAPDAVAVMSIAPTPDLGRRLSRSKIASALKRAGRQRHIEARAQRIQAALRTEQLQAPVAVTKAYGTITSSLVVLIEGLNAQIEGLEREIETAFEITRTPRSCAVFPDSARSSAPGCSASSETTEPATPMLKREGITRGLLRSPRRRDPDGSCSLASPATNGSSTRASCGRSRRSPNRRESAPTTTSRELAARPTVRLCVPWPTDSSASSTAVYATRPSTTRLWPGPRQLKRRLDTWRRGISSRSRGS